MSGEMCATIIVWMLPVVGPVHKNCDKIGSKMGEMGAIRSPTIGGRNRSVQQDLVGIVGSTTIYCEAGQLYHDMEMPSDVDHESDAVTLPCVCVIVKA